MKTIEHTPADVEAAAAEIFVQRLQGAWSPAEQSALDVRLAHDPVFAEAYTRVAQAWGALDTNAETPELMCYREEAIAYARRANARRWQRVGAHSLGGWGIAAAVVGAVIALGVIWQLSPLAYVPGQYRTGIGEQRIIELDDHSRIALDATTRLTVHYSKDARSVELTQGQAEFSVAHDPARPFKVIAGNRTIIAVGTVFTVDMSAQGIRVATVEGRVAVASTESQTQRPHPTEVAAGEELRVNESGQSTFTPKADLAAATAWRAGKVIFRTEQLGDAVRRINRYSRVQVEIEDASLATHRISGVFETGDTQGFVSAVEQYLPVVADRSESDRIRLRLK